MSNESGQGGGMPSHQPARDGSRIDDGTIVEDPTVRDHPRYQQMFPVLTGAEVDRVRRFGSLSRYARGDFLYRAGSLCPGMFVLLSGKVRIVGRDGLGHERIIHTYTQRGEFTSDVTQLSSKPAVVDAHVIEDVEAVLVRPDELSAIMISEADLGEKIMRALILRRVLVIEREQGVVLVGSSNHPRLLALQMSNAISS